MRRFTRRKAFARTGTPTKGCTGPLRNTELDSMTA